MGLLQVSNLPTTRWRGARAERENGIQSTGSLDCIFFLVSLLTFSVSPLDAVETCYLVFFMCIFLSVSYSVPTATVNPFLHERNQLRQ